MVFLSLPHLFPHKHPGGERFAAILSSELQQLSLGEAPFKLIDCTKSQGESVEIPSGCAGVWEEFKGENEIWGRGGLI